MTTNRLIAKFRDVCRRFAGAKDGNTIELGAGFHRAGCNSLGLSARRTVRQMALARQSECYRTDKTGQPGAVRHP